MHVHDEVCGMTIDAESAPATTDFQGETYYFCSERCLGMFVEHPDRFVAVREGDEEVGTAADHACH